ncbi:methionyl-tRNA formyltransferase, partial [Bradyrhizobium elkanii]|uniref:methionyl-tRNA formyltransferase n=1 Tax=Bradyrhizobium elkanii TaxID=29448 RepID=UPI0005C1C3BB
PVRLEERTPIDGKTAGLLTAELSMMGARLMVAVLADLEGHPAMPQPEEGVTYAGKIDKAEARLDFARSAVEVDRQVRAFNPAPGAFFEFQGERIKVLAASILTDGHLGSDFSSTPGLVLDEQLTIGCTTGAIRPDVVQRSGRGVMTSLDLLRGLQIPG